MAFLMRCGLLVAALSMLTAFCSPTAPDAVDRGVWGGEHISLDVTATGATVEFDCAHGTLDSPLTLDGKGEFDVKGTFTREQPGPIRDTSLPQAQAARYTGRVDASTLTLSVRLTESDELIGSFTLKQGTKARVLKCR